MASGPVVGGDDGAKEKPKHKVYTRKAFKDRKKDPNSLNTAADTATVKNDDTATTTATTAAQNDNNATAMNDGNPAATIAATTTAKHDDTSTSSTIATTTAKNDDSGTATSTVTATAKKDTPIATTKNDDAATTTAIPSVSETATATPSTTTTTATLPANTTTTVVETATATKNIDDSSNSINITIKISETDEPKGNCNDISEEALPPLGAVPENGNSVQLQVSPRLKDGSFSGPQEKSRLEGWSSAVLEDGNSNQPQKIPRLEDGSSSGKQEKIRIEDGSSCQSQEKSRIKGGAPAPHQESSRLEDGIPAPQQESSLNDGVSAMRFEKSRLEKENSALVQENSRLEDGESAQLQKASRLEDENLVQPQVDSRLEDEDSAEDQPQGSSRLEDENVAQPQASSRLEDKDLTLDQPQGSSRLDVVILAQPQVSSRVEDEDLAQDQTHVGSRMDVEILAQPLTSSRLEDANLALPQVGSNWEGGKSAQPPVCSHQQEEPSTSLNVIQNLPLMNETMEQVLEDRIKISLLSTSKQERQELRWKLESELDIVRNLVKRIELKQGQAGMYGRLNVLVGDGINNSSGTKRSLSEVASAGFPRGSVMPLHQLSLSMLENSQGVSESVEKEKRTPKANQFYRNSEFLLAKDKFPPAESNKKSKLSLKMQGGGEMGQGFAMGSKFFKSCNSLLEKLMKHKHAWVFNTPVDVEGLGLHDYHSIITHPMDLGTVKSRLNKNWYKSPKEFAEDVRLTFQNAMTYNPKGQDVHVMAEQLSKIFEDRWAIIESDYNREMRYGIDYGAAPLVPSSLSRKVPTFPPPPPLDTRRILDRSESLKHTPRFMTITPSSRTPAPKKPKAKDPNKRDMTFEEKQKLSTNLQSLPSEKLDAIVQIIKKRNSALSQHDNEIEVDIDSVDAETLWELDRFVTNYKKSLSKNKRKLELAQARAEAARNALQKTHAPVMVEVPRETQAGRFLHESDERNVPPSLPVQGANLAGNGSRSSSSSSSSSDSGSSSSDSDSDSSSASGSDAGSQGT